MARASLRSTSPPFQQKGAPFIPFFHSQSALEIDAVNYPGLKADPYPHFT
jgi:hypothetical protein